MVNSHFDWTNPMKDCILSIWKARGSIKFEEIILEWIIIKNVMRTFTKFEKGKVFIFKKFKKIMLNPAMMGEKKTNLYYFSPGREKRNQFPFWFRLLWLPQSSSSTQKSHESSEKKGKKKKEEAHQEFNTPTGNWSDVQKTISIGFSQSKKFNPVEESLCRARIRKLMKKNYQKREKVNKNCTAARKNSKNKPKKTKTFKRMVTQRRSIKPEQQAEAEKLRKGFFIHVQTCNYVEHWNGNVAPLPPCTLSLLRENHWASARERGGKGENVERTGISAIGMASFVGKITEGQWRQWKKMDSLFYLIFLWTINAFLLTIEAAYKFVAFRENGLSIILFLIKYLILFLLTN